MSSNATEALPRLADLPDMLTVAEYARWARRGREGAYHDVRAGVVPSVRLGHCIRIPKAALARLAAAEQDHDAAETSDGKE